MKTLFIEAKAKINVEKLIDKAKLSKKIGLVSSVQYLDNLKDIQDYLSRKGIESIITGQVLGCNVTVPMKYNKIVDEFLFIGSRGFHPVEIARITKKRVIVVNPITNEVDEIRQEEVNAIEKRKKGRVIKYLSSKNTGILVTVKPGQENMHLALFLKDKIKDKKTYIFVGNELMENDLINFSGVESWINTACSRIEINKVVNFDEIVTYLNKDK